MPANGQDESCTTSESSGSEKSESVYKWDAIEDKSQGSNDSDDNPNMGENITTIFENRHTAQNVSQASHSSQPRRDRNSNGGHQHTVDRLSESLAVTHLDTTIGSTIWHPSTAPRSSKATQGSSPSSTGLSREQRDLSRMRTPQSASQVISLANFARGTPPSSLTYWPIKYWLSRPDSPALQFLSGFPVSSMGRIIHMSSIQELVWSIDTKLENPGRS